MKYNIEQKLILIYPDEFNYWISNPDNNYCWIKETKGGRWKSSLCPFECYNPDEVIAMVIGDKYENLRKAYADGHDIMLERPKSPLGDPKREDTEFIRVDPEDFSGDPSKYIVKVKNNYNFNKNSLMDFPVYCKVESKRKGFSVVWITGRDSGMYIDLAGNRWDYAAPVIPGEEVVFEFKKEAYKLYSEEIDLFIKKQYLLNEVSCATKFEAIKHFVMLKGLIPCDYCDPEDISVECKNFDKFYYEFSNCMSDNRSNKKGD